MSLIAATPKKGVKARPQLPIKQLNPLLKTGPCYLSPLVSIFRGFNFHLVDKEPIVKYQVIEREGQEIVVRDRSSL